MDTSAYLQRTLPTLHHWDKLNKSKHIKDEYTTRFTPSCERRRNIPTCASNASGQTRTGRPSGKTYRQLQFPGQQRGYGTDTFTTYLYSRPMKDSTILDELQRIDGVIMIEKTHYNTDLLNVEMRK